MYDQLKMYNLQRHHCDKLSIFTSTALCPDGKCKIPSFDSLSRRSDGKLTAFWGNDGVQLALNLRNHEIWWGATLGNWTIISLQL